jgi:SAM-dependent methyltransferase
VLERLRLLVRQPVLRRCPGQPVDVLMPADLPVQDPTFVVSGKTDGTRLLMLGLAVAGSKSVQVFFVDRALAVFRGGDILTSGFAKAAHHKPFALDTERHGDALWILDVLVFKGRSCLWGARAFLDRIKFSVPLLLKLRDAALPCGLRLRMKPFYDIQSLSWVVAREKAKEMPFPTDGLVFVNREFARARPLKWKPPGSHTCDFYLCEDDNALFLEAPDVDQGTVYVDRLAEPFRCTGVRRPGRFGVVECRYVVGREPQDPDPQSPLPAGCWEVVRERRDKDTANSVHVFDRNVQLIRANVTRRDLLHGPQLAHAGRDEDYCCEPFVPDDGSGAAQPETPYFSATATKRWNSRSLVMKNFHNNVVKGLGCYKAAGGTEVQRLLELGIGRGADLPRITEHFPNLVELVGLDKSKPALQEANKRWLQANRCSARGDDAPQGAVDARFEVLDLTSAFGCEMFSRRHEDTFDMVACNFAVHYFHDSVPSFAASVLRTDGVFVCTLFDGAAVRALLLEQKPEHAREWVMGGDVQTRLELLRDEQHVAVFVDTIGHSIVEPLVDVDEFVDRMRDEDMVLENRRSFSEFDGGEAFPPTHPMRSFSNLYVLLSFRKTKVSPWDM